MARSPARRRRRRKSTLGRWIRRALVALLACALLFVAATALPVCWLRERPVPTTAFMWLARRADPATGEPCERVAYDWVERQQISPDLALAIVAAEDQRFMVHRGFDLKQIEAALRDRESGGRQRGASTLSQQVAKNLFLWPAGGFVRKGIEALLTLWIEWLWGKQRILEVYMNVAQFGPCTFGAEAASRAYFGRPARELDAAQAALLAAVLPSPARLRAWNPGPYVEGRRDEILQLMESLRGSQHVRGL